jgi:hypothetical protein
MKQKRAVKVINACSMLDLIHLRYEILFSQINSLAPDQAENITCRALCYLSLFKKQTESSFFLNMKKQGALRPTSEYGAEKQSVKK